jgi:hypothetical protein
MRPKKYTVTAFFSCLLMFPLLTHAQDFRVGEVLMISNSGWKKTPDGVKPSIQQDVIKKKPGIHMGLFQADRGDRNGDFLLACSIDKASNRTILPAGSPFTDEMTSFGDSEEMKPSAFLTDPLAYTEYRLIGAEKFRSLPAVRLLGIHYIKVREERATDFDQFVVEKLHPAVGQLLPDMQLLYYKAVAGENEGTYITIFTIASNAAREKYWPEGKPETAILKQAFLPLRALGRELKPYLVEGSYLEEEGGAAAYFESKEWTDFLMVSQ